MGDQDPPTLTATPAGHAPRTRHEVVVGAVFAEVLALSLAGTDDDFFALGGDSLGAARLAGRLTAVSGVGVGLDDVLRAPTVAGLARLLDTAGADTGARSGSGALDPVLALRTGGDGNPLFCVHPITGLTWCYTALLRHIGPGFPVYGLQSRGLADLAPLPATVEEMAVDYADRMRAAQPEGPYRLLGWSLGGVIAHAVATELQHRGEQVELLALLDAYPSDPSVQGADEHLRILFDIVLGDFGYDPRLLDGEPLEEARLVEVIRAAGGPLSGWSDDAVAHLVRITRNNATAVDTFAPRTFHGDMLFFAAMGSQALLNQTTGSWLPHLDGRLLTQELDCMHAHLMRPANAARVGRVLRPALAGTPRARPAHSAAAVVGQHL